MQYKDNVLFRISKDDKPDAWDGSMVERIVFHGFEFNKTYEFVETTFNRKPEWNLYELVSEGEVNLYSDDFTYWTVSLSTGKPTISPALIHGRDIFVKRKIESKFTSFGGSKKKIAAYFNNCSGIVKKLETNEFNIGTIREIVEYYNDLCIGHVNEPDEEAPDEE